MSLEQYATDRQKEYLKALDNNNGSTSGAARELGVNVRSLQRSIASLKSNAERNGWYSESHIPSGGKSIYRRGDPDSDVIGYWDKHKPGKQEEKQAFQDFVSGLCEGIKGKSKPIKTPKGKKDKDLMSLIIFGDAHLGMYAWADETRSMDFDTDICVKDMRDAIDNMIARAPDAETGVLVNVGDFMHMNNATATTAAGTGVDVDTRYQRVLRMAGMVMRYCIDKMLLKFKYVQVVVAKGNHDPEPAVAIALMLQFYYDKDKRVKVLDTIGHHHYITFGDWLIGVNHGDKMKPQKLVAMMARDHKGWSKAKFRIWITGHIHHEKVIEIDGCTVFSFNTLAPRDAWHASMGYGSRQAATLKTIHKTKGSHSTIEYDLPEKTL